MRLQTVIRGASGWRTRDMKLRIVSFLARGPQTFKQTLLLPGWPSDVAVTGATVHMYVIK
jgi:hypothetical protein